MRRFVLAATVLIAAAASEYAFAQTAPSAFRPHRAVYNITLADGTRPDRNQTRLEGARGRLVYEFMGSACEGWTTNLRFVTELRLGQGQSHVSDIRSNTVESPDFRDMRFVTRSIVNNRDRDSADGRATRQDDRIQVQLQRPQARTAELTGAILFPTQHLTGALEAARRGERFFAADIYDGSEGGEKVYATTAVIRRSITGPGEGHPANVEALRTMPRWPMTISFFDRGRQGSGEQIPLYELTVEVYEAGITHSLLINYGEFALRGTMTSLELLPVQPCN